MSDDVSGLWELALDRASNVPIQIPPGWPDLETVNEALDGYEVFETIGAGGMGVVYKAWQEKLDRNVAIKLIPLASNQGDWLAQRLGREAKIMARLSHPNIVPVYDFGADDEFCWIVMEHVCGIDLGRLLQTQPEPIPGNEVAKIAIQIAEALAYAHDKGVIHRDVKPTNILIEEESQRIRMIDFGISRSELPVGITSDIRLTMTGTFLGTEAYAAPELLASEDGTKLANERSDIYSCGVLFYEMLTGTVPRGMFPLPSKISQACQGCDSVITKCLARDPEERFENARALLSEIRLIQAPPPQQQDSKKTNDKTSAPKQARADSTNYANPLRYHNLLLLTGLFCFFFACALVGTGENRFSFVSTASPKQFHAAVALTSLTSLFNILWTLAVWFSWRKVRHSASSFTSMACTAFVFLGNSLIVYLAVSD